MRLTPIRSIRVPDHIWFAAKDKAAERGTTISAVIRHGLERWVTEGSKDSKN